MLLSSSGPGRSTEVEVSGGLELTHSLGELLPRLARYRTRRALERSPVYQELKQHIEDVSFALEYGEFNRRRCEAGGERLRVVSWNIQRGKHLAGVIEVLRCHPELRSADVILLLESDLGMARSGNQNVARCIARELGYDYVYGNSYLCLSAGNRQEHAQSTKNTLSLSGNAVLSRRPLLRAENLSLMVTRDKFESGEKRLGHKKALWVETQLLGRSLGIAAVHLDSGASSQQRARQLTDLVDQLARRGVANHCLIGGDYNTTTYDAASVPRLLRSLAQKLWRGGFPHAIEHYLHPDRLYELPVFEVLTRGGYSTQGYNTPGVGTLRYEVGDVGSEGRVRDFLPQVFIDILRRKLEPYGGVVGLKVDWFAGQGLIPLAAGTVDRPKHQQMGVSDHDPIWVEVMLAP